MNPELLGVFVYLVAMLGIGAAVARRIRTEDDYLVAGRRLGPLLLTGTMFATWFGAETCLGSAGEVYTHGVSLTSAEPLAYGLCLALMGLLLAARLWQRKLVTLADLLRERYSGGVERTAALLMIPTSLLWAAAQVRALGHLVATSSDLDVPTAVGCAAAIAALYTAFGGLLADALNDMVQGIALVLGLGVIFVAVLLDLGGVAGAARAVDPEALTLLPPDAGALALLEAWSVPILGSLVAQELVTRVSAARSARVARGAALAAGGIYVAVGLVPVALGLMGRSLAPDLEDPEHVLPVLARAHLGPVGQVLFTGALVAAILSTVDSTLLVCSSLFAHNVLLPVIGPSSEQRKIRLARRGVLAFAVLAWALAVRAPGVHALVEQASAFGSSGILVVVLFALFTRTGTAMSAYAALVTGVVVYVGGAALGWPYPYVASLAGALLAYAMPVATARLVGRAGHG